MGMNGKIGEAHQQFPASFLFILAALLYTFRLFSPHVGGTRVRSVTYFLLLLLLLTLTSRQAPLAATVEHHPKHIVFSICQQHLFKVR